MKRITSIIRNVPQHWVGDGFPVRSLFSYADGNQFDPFLLLDYAGPHMFAPAAAPRGVGEHPHRGFETITIVTDGEVAHRDSAGHAGVIGPGDVQWMTAASGVVHEEFHSERFTRDGGRFELVQLWLNLPSRFKMTSPRYQNLTRSMIPIIDLPNGAGTARIIAGQFDTTTGPAQTMSPVNLWELHLTPNAIIGLDVPEGHTTLVLVQSGSVNIGDPPVTAVELALLDRAGSGVRLNAADDATVLILTGEPLNEPVVGQGPFVMNTREQIQQAIQDYRAGRMGRLA
jgi:hypothetical protein